MRPPAPRPLVIALALALAAGAQAQESRGRTVELAPYASITQTVTDNQREGQSASGAGDAVTALQAGLRLASRTGRLTGNVDYSLTGVVYARDTGSNELQNRLNANLASELVDRRLFVNAQAAISQQAISALGPQSPDGRVRTGNQTETRTLAVQPRFEGRLGDAIDLRVQASASMTDTGGAQGTSDSANALAAVGLASSTGGKFGWSFDATRQYVDFETGRRTVDDRVVLGLSLRPDIDWTFRLRGGAESNNFRRAEGTDQYDNWGAGVLWTPSARTRVSVDADRRSFGHSHAIAIEHRARRVVFRYTDAQDVSRGSAETAGALIGAFELFDQLYASQEPDPALRAQLIDSVLERNNLQRDSQIAVGFLTSALSVQRRMELSMLLEGQRTSVIASVFASNVRRADTITSVVDDTSGGNHLRQRGLSFNLTHRLTPSSSLSVVATGVRTQETAGRRTDLRSVSAFWSDRLGPRTNLSLGVRHSEYDADVEPYTENAIIANLSLRF